MNTDSQLEKITCPKCGFIQATSDVCIKCGLIFNRYEENKVKKEIEKKKQEQAKKEEALYGCGCFTIIALVVLIILIFKFCGSEEKNIVTSEKVVSDKQVENISTDKKEKVSKHCESEVDKQICYDVNLALSLYYKIANQEPQGYYNRDKAMSNLQRAIAIERQKSIDEFGHTDSLVLYTSVFNFVNFRESAEKARIMKDNDGYNFSYKISEKNYSEIINFCEPCIDEME